MILVCSIDVFIQFFIYILNMIIKYITPAFWSAITAVASVIIAYKAHEYTIKKRSRVI